MTDAFLNQILAQCGCGRDHTAADDVGECDVPLLVAELRATRAEVERLAKAVWEARMAGVTTNGYEVEGSSCPWCPVNDNNEGDPAHAADCPVTFAASRLAPPTTGDGKG